MSMIGVNVAVLRDGKLLLTQRKDVEVWFHRQRIADAFAGIGGSVAWKQEQPWPFDEDPTRRQFYALRDQSGLSRQELFLTHFDEDVGSENREVGPESE